METVKELAKILEECDCKHSAEHCDTCPYIGEEGCLSYFETAKKLVEHGVTIAEPARPLEEWHEDYGIALWWTFPIEEPPYVGSPLDLDWPGYHTHWTLISPLPAPPKGVQE